MRGATIRSVVLTAMVGAWVGHLLEYVRVAGWDAGLAEMTSSVHSYFFPAGAALTALIVGLVVVARSTWNVLGRRIRAAETCLWRRPRAPLPHGPVDPPGQAVRVVALWLLLSMLQTTMWVIQENLEAVAAGHRAPLLGVVSGVHRLAPVIQAEMALILASTYSLVQRWFLRRRSRLSVLERLVARRWNPTFGLLPVRWRAAGAQSTPLERWGRQRWQRPPPIGAGSLSPFP
jgi:hypothetical protein